MCVRPHRSGKAIGSCVEMGCVGMQAIPSALRGARKRRSTPFPRLQVSSSSTPPYRPAQSTYPRTSTESAPSRVHRAASVAPSPLFKSQNASHGKTCPRLPHHTCIRASHPADRYRTRTREVALRAGSRVAGSDTITALEQATGPHTWKPTLSPSCPTAQLTSAVLPRIHAEVERRRLWILWSFSLDIGTRLTRPAQMNALASSPTQVPIARALCGCAVTGADRARTDVAAAHLTGLTPAPILASDIYPGPRSEYAHCPSQRPGPSNRQPDHAPSVRRLPSLSPSQSIYH
ncbi:hypothetical protein FA95DRAFT_222777 [Auriscalpium vulgare]|uniref:Uncharacterized protein n=1 Tax=Auriscalpium vulgare TaxID=40419 RepID=A0ACB8RL86_9AGAM|nr:hypothetical protein FA95DRAFT_222777 [Auriscalpium vulgare]